MKKIGSFVGGMSGWTAMKLPTFEKSEIIKNVIVGGKGLKVLTET